MHKKIVTATVPSVGWEAGAKAGSMRASLSQKPALIRSEP